MAGENNDKRAEAVGTLEEEALRRKQRLQALKNKKSDTTDGRGDAQTANSIDSLPRPVFRSYKPHDEKLKENALPRAKPESLEDQVKDELEATKTKPVIEGLDFTNLAPRKPDWDLKRDVAKKLEKLERQTQRAIAELIRARLKKDEDLATAVNVGIKFATDTAFED